MVSICMATYNGEKFIYEQCDSILKQISLDDELIISDDGSTDQTIDIVRSFNDSRIKIIKNTGAKGYIKNFENALRHVQGELIFLTDQDDVWLDTKYKIMKRELKNYDLVVSDAIVVDEKLEIIHDSLFEYLKSGTGIIKNFIRASYYGSCMAMKKSVLVSALPFPDTSEIGHDLWLGLVAEITRKKVLFLKIPLIKYRRHGLSFTGTGIRASKRSIGKIVAGRFIMIIQILNFYLKHKLCKKV